MPGEIGLSVGFVDESVGGLAAPVGTCLRGCVEER
jgi:hypothetical protein